MGRCLERVGMLEIRLLDEVTAHLGHEEDDEAEHEQEHHHRHQVVDRVIGMKRDTVQRHSVGTLVFLDLDAVGVVRSHLVQRQEMQHHQGQQHDRQGHHVQREEAIQRDAGNEVITAHPFDDGLAEIGYGAEQRNDHLCAPVGHLAPGQHISEKGFGHQRQVDGHAEQPHEFPRRPVGTVQETAEHVQIDHQKEGRGTGGMQVAQDPAVVDIAHDVLDRGEGAVPGGLVAHGEPDAGDQLVDQHQQRKHSEEVPEIEVLGRIVLAHVGVPCPLHREPGIDPPPKSHQPAHAAVSSSTPMITTLSKL